MKKLDQDGQPHPSFHQAANLKKATESLLGICRGIAADRQINTEELVFLDTWLKDNAHVTQRWPGSVIAERVTDVLADGVVTQDEADDLLETLNEITGMDLDHGIVSGLASTAAAETAPSPIEFEGRVFCFTGKFVYGPRKKVEKIVKERGGKPAQNVTNDLDYLVIGGLASRDWAHTSHGRKIEAAREKRDAGVDLMIIEEEHWTAAL